MELITSNHRGGQVATTATTDPRCIAIANKHGNAVAFAQRWGVDKQTKCLLAIATSTTAADMTNNPPVVLAIKTYGDAVVLALLVQHLSDAILFMGETRAVDAATINATAALMLSNARLRVLSLASLLGFFARFKGGEFKIYGEITPRKIMEAAQDYATEAIAAENALRQRAEKEAAEAERRRHAAEAIPAREFLKDCGAGSIAELFAAGKLKGDNWRHCSGCLNCYCSITARVHQCRVTLDDIRNPDAVNDCAKYTPIA